MDNLDDLLNEHGFTTTPIWMEQAIEKKDPHMTLGLACSVLYRVKAIDKGLGTLPLVEKIIVEVN